MAHAILIAVYVVGAILKLVGIAATVSVFIRNNKDGTFTIAHPRGWLKWRGPVMIGVGIVIGLIGNVWSLFVR